MAPTFTNVGKAQTVQRLNSAGAIPKYIGIGTGTTAEAATQTALVTEVETRANGTVTAVTTTVAGDTFQTVGTITATAARAVTEVGLFDALTVGNMYMRAVFAAVNLATGDSIQITGQIVYS